MSHTPVLLAEMLAALAPRQNEVYVDATFGGGGYSRAILETADCRVVAFDRDPEAVERGKSLEKDFPDRFQIKQGTFSQLKDLLKEATLTKVHGFVFDLGISTYQIEKADRGFSFRFSGPLDMRMSHEGITAAEVVNTYSEHNLANIIYKYGEEKKSRAIARKIVAARLQTPFSTTRQLADLVKLVIKGGKEGIHPATQTFQALRIFVNNELEEIDRGLKVAEECLVEGGRLVVVTFHSLEDKLVKHFLRNRQTINEEGSRYLPNQKNHMQRTFGKARGKAGSKGVKPQDEEVLLNPKSRSAA